jgi:hypothetical protein
MLDVSFPLFLSPFRVHTMKVKLVFCLRVYSEASLIFLFLLCSPSNLNAQLCEPRHSIFGGGKQKKTEEEEGKKNEIKGQGEGDRRVEE